MSSTSVGSLSANYKVLSSADLVYRVFHHPVSLAPMTVLSERTAEWGVWTVSFYVLGASHAMRLTNGYRQITEVLSCFCSVDSEAEFVEPDVVGRDHYVTIPLGDMNINFQLVTRPIGDAEPFVGTAAAPGDNWLAHAYQSPDLAEPAWTRLTWNLSSAYCRLHTLHTYPQEGLQVQSVTTISKIPVQSCADGR